MERQETETPRERERERERGGRRKIEKKERCF